ncbi:MAG: acyl-ACP--UDP-N-acetylglucosamine O-acyltransferase [Candidatus Omnitrophica bacterium]|nr:acyl-ACP--UDP-N-acetylglucosamine O-acyltransferase [Candidatus Omnitrophota bacterium]
MADIYNTALVHPTAVISKKAGLGKGVEVGPYTVIDGNVSIGEGTVIGAHCVIIGNTSVGKNCRIYTGAVVGAPPQDLKYKGEKSFLVIGDNNTIREYATINPGTGDGGRTIIGDNNLFMANAHVAHDCVIGNQCVLVNAATLAGHVVIEDKVLISGLTAVHQFVRVGKLAIVGGCTKVVQDIPPFSTCDGHPARIYGLNLIGLKRNNIPRDTIDRLKHAYKVIFRSGLTIKNALSKMEQEDLSDKEVAHLVDFLKRKSSRGVSRFHHSDRFESEDPGI